MADRFENRVEHECFPDSPTKNQSATSASRPARTNWVSPAAFYSVIPYRAGLDTGIVIRLNVDQPPCRFRERKRPLGITGTHSEVRILSFRNYSVIVRMLPFRRMQIRHLHKRGLWMQ